VVALFGGREEGGESPLASRSSSPESLLQVAREYDRKGNLQDAAAGYEAAIATAGAAGEHRIAAEALRRLAVVHCRRQESDIARALCARSEALGRAVGDDAIVAEALNTAGGLDLVEERFDDARARFLQAASLARDPDLRGRIEQNLATIAGTRGDFAEALDRYHHSLAGFKAAGDVHGCAVAYHNLGVISLDLRQWGPADGYLRLCLDALRRTGDLHLRGLAHLNRAQALIGLDRLREARVAAETAAAIFDELHTPRELADAYCVLGAVCRRAGELVRAQSRLRMAIEIASTSRCALGEAEATRELALTLAAKGQRAQAVATMARAARELERLKPAGRPETLLAAGYPASIRAWGDLIAVLDPAAGTIAEQAGSDALTAARALGVDETAQARAMVVGFLVGLDVGGLPREALPWDVLALLRRLDPSSTTAEEIASLVAADKRRAEPGGVIAAA
jgi:tetratricopeptide (TPR) repeat protein